MNRKNFGKIVASLRQDLDVTQSQLAERSEIPLPIISQIERGVKRHFDSELLVALADALELSTYERRHFFLMATRIPTHEMVRPNKMRSASDTANAEKELAKIEGLSSQLRVPAFVIDPFCDFVMANRSMMALFNITDDIAAMLGKTPLGYSSIHLTFGKGLFTRLQIDWNWEQYAFNTMRSFRELSLAYRAHPYFEYLMKTFQDTEEYPFFERFWKMTASVEDDKEANWDVLEYKDKKFGQLKYLATSVIFITIFGELNLIHYQPMNENTAQAFTSLVSTYGTEMLRFAPWPRKEYPK